MQVVGGDGPGRCAFSSSAGMAEHNAESEHRPLTAAENPALMLGHRALRPRAWIALRRRDRHTLARVSLSGDEIDEPLTSMISQPNPSAI